MIPELGHFALILAFCFAVMQSVAGGKSALLAAQSYTNAIDTTSSKAAVLFCLAQFIFLLISFISLEYAFITNDFSVVYVSAQSHSDLPLMYRISGLWGGHEGSLLLWVLMLSGWGAMVALRRKALPRSTHATLIAILGLLSLGFLAFILFTSNPFARLLPIIPIEGQDLNPLLQDPALIIHPPLLYMGYVGFSVAFACAVTALITGRFDRAYARWMRPWTLMAWLFLTLGIVIGSWWAYYVLGWGGWWFWDPVENASFMPWLLGCALIHTLAVVEKRNAFKRWAILLAMTTFFLCLLGTFLVRSGILTSVHAFANDPERGLYILIFLAVVMGAALVLYLWRAPQIKHTVGFDYLSRENFLLINNVLLTLACATVFLGTLYPLFLEIFTQNKISVGPPYFSSVFVPLMIFLFIFMGAAPQSEFKTTPARSFILPLSISAVSALVLAGIVGFFLPFGVMITVALGSWIIFTLLENLLIHYKSLTASNYGMVIAHLGAAVLLLGVGLSKQMEIETDVSMQVGDHVLVGPYTFTLTGLNPGFGPNYTTIIGDIQITRKDKLVTVLHPEKRTYTANNIAQSQTAIAPGLLRDLYVALGEPLGKNRWSVRVYYKPFVRWIWLGGLLIAAGALCAFFDKRYRIKSRVQYV